MIKKIILSLFFLMFLISFVSSAKAVPQIIDSGCEVRFPAIRTIQQNSNVTAYLHVINITTGSNTRLTNETTTCYAHLYNLTDHLLEQNYTGGENNLEFKLDIDSGNFSEVRDLTFYIECVSTDSICSASGSIEVNPSGRSLTESEAMIFNFSVIFLMIFFTMSLIGIFTFESPTGKLACYWICHIFFVIITFSVWQFNETLAYTGIAGLFRVLFYFSIIAVLPMILASLSWIFYIHLMNDDIKKMMERGMDEKEAYQRAKAKRRNKK